MCQVKKKFPHLGLVHSPILQVDHCFSRRDKNLFLDPRNGTVICSTCNMLKKYQSKSVHRCVDEIVFNREGQNTFLEMKKINQSMAPNSNWGKRFWLEEQLLKLEKGLND